MIAVKDISGRIWTAPSGVHADLLLQAYRDLKLMGQPRIEGLGQSFDDDRMTCGYVLDSGEFISRADYAKR